jgi:hypothetical protein
MILSVYLHRDRVDVLKMFGDLNDVINRILDESDEGHFDIMNKPIPPSREGAARYNVVINNENYLHMLKMFGIKSKQISLRRLVYWFVDNEIYDTLDWTPVSDFVNYDNVKINKQIDEVINKIDKLSFFVTDDEGKLTHAKDLIEMFRR